MAGLLSSADLAQIYGAMKLVTDTFFDTPVTYRVGGVSLDPFAEDRQDKEYTDYSLKALVEYGMLDRDEDKIENAGQVEKQDLKVSFNFEDLQAQGLIDSTLKPIFEYEKDQIIIRGETYQIVNMGLDGPMSDKNVLVVLTCRPYKKVGP